MLDSSAEKSLALRCCDRQVFEHGSWRWYHFLFQLADRVVDKATLAFEPSVGCGRVSGAPAEGDGDRAAAATANATQGSMDIAGVSRALDWWESKRADIDERCHRVTVEGKRSAMDSCTCTVLFVRSVPYLVRESNQLVRVRGSAFDYSLDHSLT